MRHATGSSSIQFFNDQFFIIQFFSIALFLLAGMNPSWAQANQMTVSTQAERPFEEQPSMAEQYRQVGDAYESMMVNHFYGQLKSSQGMWVDPDSPFAPSNGEKIFQSMHDQLVMENVAKRRPFGVSDLVVQQLEGKGGVRTQPRVNYNK